MLIDPFRRAWGSQTFAKNAHARPTGGAPAGTERQLPTRFDEIIHRVKPALDQVFLEWVGRPLSPDLWQDVELGGFGVEEPTGAPIAWDVTFETKGEKGLGITIPFVGDDPQLPVVDR